MQQYPEAPVINSELAMSDKDKEIGGSLQTAERQEDWGSVSDVGAVLWDRPLKLWGLR